MHYICTRTVYQILWLMERRYLVLAHTCSTLARMRVPCGKRLLKTVKSSNGTEYLGAFRTYCFKSITNSLKDLLNRPMIIELCEQWRTRQIAPNVLADIYDGQIWQHFQYDCNGDPFLAKPYNFLLMLNCDWFQPFKHTQFSVGVLYKIYHECLDLNRKML